MELKPGYKQTEVGVIPEDWEIISLGDIFTFKNGLNKGKEYFGHGTPIVNYMDVYKKPNIYVNDLTGRVAVNPQEIKNYEVRKGDMFFTRTSETVEEIGMAAVVLDNPTNTVFSGFILRARPKNDYLDNTFKAYCFSSEQVRRAIRLKSSYTTRALTNGRLLSSVVIPIPPLAEQRAIATALSDMDALLAAQDQLIAKKRDIKQAVMQQLLTGKQRLPGFSGEWEVKRLGDVLKVRHGKSQQSIIANNGKYPVLATGGEIGRTNHFVYDKPSVLIGRKGTIDAPQYVNTPFWTIDTLFYTEIASAADPKFIFYKFNMINWRSYNEASGVPSLNASTIEKIDITCPEHDEQTAIAALLSDMDAEIDVLQQRRDKTQMLKQGMMQELLTGRTRLV